MNDANLYTLLRSRFPENPDAPCLILPDGRAWTYGDIDQASGRIAGLIAALGLLPGDRVAVQVDKSPEALVLYLACLRAGTVFLPLNPAYLRHELDYFLADAKPGLLVCRPQMRELAEELAAAAGVAHVLTLNDDGRGSLIDCAAKQREGFRTVPRQDEDLAAILYTSGTTGRAKGAMLSHRNLAANARVLASYWRFKPDDVLLHMLPIYHVHGLFVASHCALMSGSAMLFEPRFDSKRALGLLPRATVFMGVPTYYVRLLNEPGFDSALCAGMRLFVSGSAPLATETFDEFRERSGHTILERYGMTEGGMFASNPYQGERRRGTVGLPLPGTELRLVADDGQPVREGEVGRIEVRGDNVFVGYWQMPDKTAEEFSPGGWFRTGDLGSADAEGYVSIVGRSKDLIITGGLNVYPKELETLIDALPGVAESAVIGLPDPDFGEAVTAVVVARNGATLGAADIIGALKGQVAGFKLPKRVFFAADLPRNAMGKVQKNLLRQQLSA